MLRTGLCFFLTALGLVMMTDAAMARPHRREVCVDESFDRKQVKPFRTQLCSSFSIRNVTRHVIW